MVKSRLEVQWSMTECCLTLPTNRELQHPSVTCFLQMYTLLYLFIHVQIESYYIHQSPVFFRCIPCFIFLSKFKSSATTSINHLFSSDVCPALSFYPCSNRELLPAAHHQSPVLHCFIVHLISFLLLSRLRQVWDVWTFLVANWIQRRGWKRGHWKKLVDRGYWFDGEKKN